jgi:hypothetical protein
MRPALTAVLLIVATLPMLQLPDAHAARGDLPTVASRARRCERITRRLQAQERRTVARGTCTTLEGCTLRQRRRWARIAETFADDCVALNQVQVLGSHNSYHIQPRPALLAALLAFSPTFSEIEYTHVPLPQQFDEQGIRQIEIDVFADPMGGLYAHREGLAIIGENPDSGIPALSQPGFKVLHLQDIDFETTCLTFVDCLQQVKSWSDAHPGHLPIMILIEAKDDLLPPVIDFTIPVPIGVPEFAALDAEIRSVFPPEQLITPDDIRRGKPTLDEAVRTLGWPPLGAARGKVLFCLDNGGVKRDDYRTPSPILEGRILFTDASPGDPDAAFVKENDPLADPGRISELVRSGYIVRTRADADTHQARTGDTTDREAALESGAQYVSTDYPVPDPDFGTGYFVAIPDGVPGRCNPVNAPAGCRSSTLERPF